MIDLGELTAIQRETARRWHTQPVDNPYDGFLAIACALHACNFLLWHEVDAARLPGADDGTVARARRAIDDHNQQRNEWIERLDAWLTDRLAALGVAPAVDARLSTETPGGAIDRLSVLALRAYHLEAQAAEPDLSRDRADSVRRRLVICRAQQGDLVTALAQLIDDIVAGRVRYRTYGQLKMYTDPVLDPPCLGASQSAANARAALGSR